MADATRLKKKAAEFEAKRQYDRAVGVYEQIITETPREAQEADVPVFNRAGDLYLRLGNVERAVTLYERAVDLYAELGFFNNAIALCNKILRQTPNRASIYYKLGKISAKKGFNSDAKQNFLEYATRMQRTGKLDEAFRALKEFADLCPGQDDVRLMLAEQLHRVGRKTEALEQLQLLHEQLDAEGRSSEAAAAVERIKAIDPNAQPRRTKGPTRRQASDLVFLDLDEAVLPGIVEPAPVEGLEPTSLQDQLPTRARPLTPQQFAVVDLPPPAEEAAEARERERVLEGLPVIDQLRPEAAAGASTLGVTIPMPPAKAPAVEEMPRTPPVERPLPAAAEEPPPPSPPPLRAPEATPLAVAPAAAAAPAAPSTPAVSRPDDELIDLGEWLRGDDMPRSTRMVAEAEVPPEGEQADFEEMLAKFKQGVAANMDEEDYASHYDLGVAFKEMGLLDEAIAEFQKALRGPSNRVATYEAIGQCFVEKRQHEVAITLLQRALREPGFDDEQFLGVLYLLGYAHEALGRHGEAASYYQRVLAVDITFRDVSERLAAVTQASR